MEKPMAFWNRTNSTLTADVETIVEACLWLRTLDGKPFEQCVAAIRTRGWEESYYRKDFGRLEYGFFLCNRKMSGHISESRNLDKKPAQLGADSRLVCLEGHEEYFGIVVTINLHSLGADLKEAVRQKGKSAKILQKALLHQGEFTSMDQLKRELLGH